MSTAVAWLVLAIGVVKLADFSAAAIVLFLPSSWPARRLSRAEPVPLDWTPVFAWGRRKRVEWKASRRRASALIGHGLIDIGFRSPVLTTLQALALILVVGPTTGKARGGSCVYGKPHAGTVHVVAATVAVLGAISTVLFFLLTTAYARRTGGGLGAPGASPAIEVEAAPDWEGAEDGEKRAIATENTEAHWVAGHRVLRTKPESRTIDAIFIIVALTVCLIVGFTALYLMVMGADPGAFAAPTCSLTVAGALYAGVALSGTYAPTSDLAYLVVASQVFVLGVLLALFIQNVRIGPAQVTE